MRAQTSNGWTAHLASRPGQRRVCHRLVGSFAVLVTVLASTAACSAPTVAGNGSPVPGSAVSVPAGVAAPAGSGPTPPAADPATSGYKARLEAALGSAVAGGRMPGAERIRTAVADAGFAADGVEVTASRTPTGLDADAVEVAVKAGRNCIVAQVRNGGVSAVILPVLADGRCLVGSTGTR